MYVTVFAAAHWCLGRQAPPPACWFGWAAPQSHSHLRAEASSASFFFLHRSFFFTPYLRAHWLAATFAPVCEPDMTFRRLKKVNSSGPETGPSCPDGDVYFPSSRSDSCSTEELRSRSCDLYSYTTLAYSGGTLPRNLKKVTARFQKLFPAGRRSLGLIGSFISLQMFSNVYGPTFVRDFCFSHFTPSGP